MYFGSFSLMLLFLVRPTTPVKCQWWLLAWDSYCSEVLLLFNFFLLNTSISIYCYFRLHYNSEPHL